MIGWPFDGAPVNVSSSPEHRRMVGADRGELEAELAAERRAQEAAEIFDFQAREDQRGALTDQGRAYLEHGG